KSFRYIQKPRRVYPISKLRSPETRFYELRLPILYHTKTHLFGVIQAQNMSGLTVVSAPGKALVAGGYLVLHSAYKSLVVALSARIYAVLQPSSGPQSSIFTVIVKSPQFKDAQWVYTCSLGDDSSVTIEQTSGVTKNAFAQQAIEHVFAYLSPFKSSDLTISIYADNEYYSRAVPQGEDAYTYRKSLPQFSPLDHTLSQVNKTGLGSSAALITSLTGALLTHFNDSINLESNQGKRIINNCAQLAHCAAQGKIGSGFDVAAATYGSCVYSTSSRSNFPSSREMNGQEFADQVKLMVNSTWDSEIESISLPRGVRVVMADVDAGSETPSMVRKVLAWKAEARDMAETLWTNLGESNSRLIKAFEKLTQAIGESPIDYDQSVKEISEGKSVTNIPFCHLFDEIRRHFQNNRRYLRTIGELSGTPIEPPEQTSLLDVCGQINGVLGCGVPGAGGLDAIFAVILEETTAENELHTLWNDWKDTNVSPLTAEGISTGIKSEDSEMFDTLWDYFDEESA
ncbi:Phosphomevalonate kinase, partial [Neolecta irregularis DAH-3]